MKKRIILIIILVVLGIAFLILSRVLSPQQNIPLEQQETEASLEPTTGEIEEQLQESQENMDESEGKNESKEISQTPFVVARLFLERYGSYSTDTSIQSYLNSLSSLVVDSFKQEIENQIKLFQEENSNLFVGKTTKLVSLDGGVVDTNQAEFEAKAQVEITRGNKKETSYQDFSIVLVNDQGKWKVKEIK